MKRFELLLLVALLGLLTVGGVVSYKIWQKNDRQDRQVTTIVTPENSATPLIEHTEKPVTTFPTNSPVPTSKATTTILPSVNLDVPFTSQAPEANWDEFHGEACEEASILMAQWYAFGKAGKKESGYANRMPVAEAEKALIDIVAWERNNVSDWKDTTAAETVRIAKEFLGMHDVVVVDNPTASDLKKYLNQSKIIVVPAAGRALGNPYYRQPGPPYHMLVVRGYTSKGFITNDPGTRNGEGFVYPEAKFMDAIHDWTGDTQTINTGLKKVIVVGREP